MDDVKNPISGRVLRFLGVFGLGCLLHVLAFALSERLTRAAVTWHQAEDEITVFVFLALWPVYVVLIGVYVALAARVRPTTCWAIAAGLGLGHGIGFTLMVYFENQPAAPPYELKPADVIVTFNPACADQPLPEDSELRRLLALDRSLSPALSDIRGDSAIAYDLDCDSKPELIIPVRCDAQEVCSWVVVATGPVREVGQFFGALLFVVRSEGPWPDVVGYEPGTAGLLIYKRVSHGQAYGYGYSFSWEQKLNKADAERFLTAVPSPHCGLDGENKHGR